MTTFKKFKASNKQPISFVENKQDIPSSAIFEEDDEEEEDDIASIDRQLKALKKSKLPETVNKQEMKDQHKKLTSDNIQLNNEEGKEGNKRAANISSKGFEEARIRDNPCAGDTTCNEDINEDDILGMLNIDACSVQIPKAKKEILNDDKLGKKRKIDEIECDTIDLPKLTCKDKRYKLDYDEEVVNEFSRMINQGKNDKINSFDDIVIDLQASQMEIENYNEVYSNRNNYAKYYILSLIEMMRYEIEEDYNNKKVRELPLVAASLELINKSIKAKSGAFERNIKNLKKKSKEEMKAFKQKVNEKARKQMGKRREKLKKRMENKELGIEDQDDDLSNDASDYEPHDGLPEDDQDEEEYNPLTKLNECRIQDQEILKTKHIDTTNEISNITDNSVEQIEKFAHELSKENSEDSNENIDVDVLNDIDVKKALEGVEDDQDEEEVPEESSEDEKDHSKEIYFLNIDEKEYSPDIKKDAQKDDLWIFMRERINSTQKIKDINDFLFVRTCWHGLGKSSRIKVKLVGNKMEANLKLNEFKYAMRSVNISQYVNLINNLINFRDAKPNMYLDSVLHINNTSFFEPLLKCDKNIVTQIKEKYSKEFNLNMDQDYVMNDCVKWFLQNDTETNCKQNVLLVHGAFGCGKSYLLVAIIQFISALLDEIGDEDTRILVSALTNVAVDRILLLLYEKGFKDFARVGSMKKINKLLLQFSHHASGNSNSTKDALKELEGIRKELNSADNKGSRAWNEEKASIDAIIEDLKNKTRKQRRFELQKKRVVGCTLAATTFEVLKKSTFKIVILDECSQMLEPHSLQAIAPFGCEKLIAVGDPLQLPPIISLGFSDLYKKQNQNQVSLYKPLFVRLQCEGLETILLRIQYRCHPSIAELSNKMFYEDNLLHGVNPESRERLLSDFEAVNFINADKGVETKSEMSYKNYYEAKFIVALLEYLQTIIENKAIMFRENNKEDVDNFTIGVIVTYKAQEDLIKSIISDSKIESLKHIQISTVDAFQGAERDVIILGCVRTRSLGFMNDYRRLNVAITRARRHLIVVGNEKLLKKNQQWKYIIDNSKNLVKGYKRCEEYLAKGKIFRDMMAGM